MTKGKPRDGSKNPGGRPPKTLADLPKGWEIKALRLFKKGASREEVQGELGMSHNLFATFMAKFEKFRDTIVDGEVFSRQWWDKQGRTNLKSRTFRDRLWDINMRNRFGLGEKVKLSNDPENPLPAPVIYLPANGRDGKANGPAGP